jgi:hypothetical protein
VRGRHLDRCSGPFHYLPYLPICLVLSRHIKKDPRQLPLNPSRIRLISVIAVRFHLLFLPTRVIHVTTAGKLAAKEKLT